MNEAHKAGLGFVGVIETDERHGKADIASEKSRAMTAGRDGSPVSPHAEQNLKLLDEMCFIPMERQKHLVQPMLDEILRLARQASPRVHSCRCAECAAGLAGGVPEGVPPGGDFEPEPEPMPDDWEPEPEPQ